MPTHFSKLEGSPSNRQRELRRKIRNRATMTRVQPSYHRDGSVDSTVTVNGVNNPYSDRRNRSRDIPQIIHIQNSKRLPETCNRPSQYDTYCQTRVSAISSNSSRYNSRRSTNRDQRDNNRHSFSQGRRSLPPTSSRPKHTNTYNTNKAPNDQQHHVVYDLTSVSAPSEPSTLTNNSSSVRSYRRAPTLVNAHGVFGNSRSSSNTRNKKQTNRIRNALNAVKHLEQSITKSYGDPYARRSDLIGIDENSYDSQNEASLMGERFADVYSESHDPLSRVNNRGTTRTNHQNQNGTKWLCDVCKEARFDSYVEAFRHEQACRKGQYPILEQSRTPKSLQQQREDVEEITGNKKNEVRIQNDDLSNNDEKYIVTHMREMSFSSSTESIQSNYCRIATTPIDVGVEYINDGSKNDSIASRETNRWLCSICKEVSFNNYSDACTHEKICKIRMEATADLRAAGIYKPACANVALPPLYDASIRNDIIDKNSENVTVNLWEEAEKLKGENHFVSPLLLTQEIPTYGDRNTHLSHKTPEHRQDISDRQTEKLQTRHETMDIIEREREGRSSIDLSETCSDEFHPVNSSAQNDQRELLYSGNEKGDAYERYVSLANQQEEQEERDRFIALAKQTREEELLSYRQGDSNDRYICLA